MGFLIQDRLADVIIPEVDLSGLVSTGASRNTKLEKRYKIGDKKVEKRYKNGVLKVENRT